MTCVICPAEVCPVCGSDYRKPAMTRETYEATKNAVRRLQERGQLPKTLSRTEVADWAFGNAAIENEKVTWEHAKAAAARLVVAHDESTSLRALFQPRETKGVGKCAERRKGRRRKPPSHGMPDAKNGPSALNFSRAGR